MQTMQTANRVRNFISGVLAAVMICGSAALAAPAKPLSFSMRYMAEEKVLGKVQRTQESSRPDIGEIMTYFPSDVKNCVVRVYRDRDHEIVKFEFVYNRMDNGGNDPSTGRPWAMPPGWAKECLKLFGEGRPAVRIDGNVATVTRR